MDIKWQITYLEISPSSVPVYDFINKLPPIAQAKLANTLELLSEFEIMLGLPHSKKLAGTPLYELRILGQNNLRIFYITQPNHKFLLVHAFVKNN